MMDLNEMRLILIVGLHTVVNALATGEMQKAVFYMLYAVACYFIITGTVWLSGKMFDTENTRRKAVRKSQPKTNKTKKQGTNRKKSDSG